MCFRIMERQAMTRKVERRCGTCKFLRMTPEKAGRRVVRKDGAYLCTFVPAWPPLPTSITEHINYRLPAPSFMCGYHGTKCPVWEAHKP